MNENKLIKIEMATRPDKLYFGRMYSKKFLQEMIEEYADRCIGSEHSMVLTSPIASIINEIEEADFFTIKPETILGEIVEINILDYFIIVRPINDEAAFLIESSVESGYKAGMRMLAKLHRVISTTGSEDNQCVEGTGKLVCYELVPLCPQIA